MRITVDHVELTAASETLRSCSIEAADIGSQLWACAGCAMPADVQSLVDQLVTASDRALDSVAAQLNAYSVDLANRAQIAVTDSLTAAVAASTGSAVSSAYGVIGGTTVGGMVIAGSDMAMGGLGSFVIGGTPPLDMQIVAPDGSSGPMMGLTTMTIGPPDYSQGPLSGVMALAEVGEKMRQRAQARIDAIVANPNSSPTDIRIAMNAQGGLADSTSHLIAPSRQEIQDKYAGGGYMSDSEIERISPHTILKPTNIFEGVGFG